MAWMLALALVQDPAPQELSSDELRKLSLEELLQVQVLSVSRRPQEIGRVPAAVSVLRGDDLRRLGVRSVQDALRYVPGASVVQLDSGLWSISIRGMTTRFANKLQVLRDGRSIYSPIFSGVFWEDQDVLWEDLDRLEVVRGPGASTWGANAVNGVINILGKEVARKPGGYVEAGAGKEERLFLGASGTGVSGDEFVYRASARYLERDSFGDGDDGSRQTRGGFRTEWTPNPEDRVVLTAEYMEGDVYHRRSAPLFPGPPRSVVFVDHEENQDGFVTAWWERTFSATSRLRVQASLEVMERDRATSKQDLQVGELSITHHSSPLAGHALVWGLEYRFSNDRIRDTFSLSYDPSEEHLDLAGFFLQDEIALVEGHLWATLGTKVEYGDYMGLQVEPTIRLAWSPVAGHSVWAAASRAVRSPSRAEHDHRVNAAVAPGPTVISIFGDSDIREEELLAVEVGYRGQPHAALTLDVAGFYNWYDDLVAGEFAGFYFESDPAPTHGVVATTTENALKALTYGVEGTATWDVVDGFRLRATYALLRVKASEKRGHPPSTDDAGLEGEPRHRGTLWASLDLPFRIEADIAARWTGHTYRPELGSWTELDARLGWRTPWGGEVGVAGRNLLHASHRESASAASGGISLTEPERAVWGYLSWRF